MNETRVAYFRGRCPLLSPAAHGFVAFGGDCLKHDGRESRKLGEREKSTISATGILTKVRIYIIEGLDPETSSG